ncbi:MAG: hypothetical protein NTZ35_06980 [Ignavibacteriales bacterium]|nr:hypothetical protein [Ignavibacteriales bacterium]
MPAILLLFVILTLMCSCAKRKENLTPDDEKLVPVYTGLLLLSEEYKASASQPDSIAYRQEVDSILSKNGLTRELFLNRLKVLAQSPLVYQQFTEKVRKDIEHRKPKQPS